MEGKLVHMELPADDTARAKKFWGELVGWKFQTFEGPVEYNMFEGDPGGAIYPKQGPDDHLKVYFGADDIDSALDKVRELGGTVKSDKVPVPSMGWYAHCEDTEGNPFSVWQPDGSAPVTEGMGAQSASA
jgi:predicted enzyme related to lactoylglutathione lyase